MIDYDFSFDPNYKSAFARGYDSVFSWWDGNPYYFGTSDYQEWKNGLAKAFADRISEKLDRCGSDPSLEN